MKRLLCCILAIMLSFGAVCPTGVLAEDDASQNAADAAPAEQNTDEINLYVDPSAESGAANTYKTIGEAAAAVQKINRNEKSVTVTIKGGTYDFTDTLSFTAKDSGSDKYPVTYRAAEGETVILNAGKKVTGVKVDDKDPISKRLPASVKNKVYKIDLSDFTEKELGKLYRIWDTRMRQDSEALRSLYMTEKQ